jgi:hypothetical protein
MNANRYCGHLRAGIGSDRVSIEDFQMYNAVNEALRECIRSGVVPRFGKGLTLTLCCLSKLA